MTSTPTQIAPARDAQISEWKYEAEQPHPNHQDWRILQLCARIKAEREQTKEDCADFVKHWLIESDNEYAVEVAVECSHALLEWDGKS